MWLTVVLVIGGVAAIGFLSDKTDKPKNETVQFKMATIDSKGTISEHDVRVARYRTLLDLLEGKNADGPNGDENVASALVAAQNQLEKRGISESLLNLMEGMNQLMHLGKADSLPDHLGVYVVLRSDLSLSNEQTIAMMKKLGSKVIHRLAIGKIRPDGAGGVVVETDQGTSYHFTADMLQ